MTSRSILDQARSDLAAIETELSALLATKSEASKTSSAFLKWRDAHSAATAERERLTTVIEGLEPAVAAEESSAAREDLLRRHNAKSAANAKLATRIRADIAKANSIMTALMRDVAKAEIEDRKINDEIGRMDLEVEPLAGANMLARGRRAEPPVELDRERVWLWTFEDTGALVGNQDSVVDRGGSCGILPSYSRNASCVKRPYEQIKLHPAKPREIPEAIWHLRLLEPNGPRVAFDGARLVSPEQALAVLERPQDEAEPSVEIELRPCQSMGEKAASLAGKLLGRSQAA
jgi:hypothetical protein